MSVTVDTKASRSSTVSLFDYGIYVGPVAARTVVRSVHGPRPGVAPRAEPWM